MCDADSFFRPGEAVTPPTYGDHAEAAAAALRELLTSDEVPTSQRDVSMLLTCREAVVDALAERLHLFGCTPRHRSDNYDRRTGLQLLAHVDQQLGTLLDRVVYELPRLFPRDEDLRPSDVLGPRQSNRVVELWRRTAVELLAGTHALSTCEDRTWVRDLGAGWYVMRDLAVATEALVVLDDRLRQLGLLSEHDRSPNTGPPEEHRLITAHIARAATWHSTTDSPDHAVPQLSDARETHPGLVHLVSTPGDVISAQRRLASYLRPMTASNSAYRGEPWMTAGTARHIVASQLYLTRIFGDVAREHPQTHELVRDFAIRQDLLQDIQPRLRYLEDVRHHDVDLQPRWQQGEITAAIRRMIQDGKSLALSGAQLLDLANATHDVTHQLAHALRRELRREGSNLARAHPIHRNRLTRIGRNSRLDIVLSELANIPAPAMPLAALSSPIQRAALRGTLDITPTQVRAPLPFPASTARQLRSEHAR